MLRLEVLAYPDKSLEVSGAILAGAEENEVRGLGALEPTRRSSPRPSRSKMTDERAGAARMLPSGSRGPTGAARVQWTSIRT
jgi:hypothetical protein